MPEMLIEKPEKKINIMMTGPPMTMESIRAKKERAGKRCPVTSWFFLFHHFLKGLTTNGEFPLNGIIDVGTSYGVSRYADETFKKWFEKRINWISKDHEYLQDITIRTENGVEKILLDLSRKDFVKTMLTEYDYAISRNLASKRSIEAYTEVALWHLVDDIYNIPRQKGYEWKLGVDLIRGNKDIKVNGKRVWSPEMLENIPVYLAGWMDTFTTTCKFDLLQLKKFGEVYSPPRFKDMDKRVLFSGKHSSLSRDLLEAAELSPANPIKADEENTAALYHLSSAGFIDVVSELNDFPVLGDYLYIVPRSKFEKIDTALTYLDSKKSPYKEHGDIAWTEHLFRALGRARAAVDLLGIPREEIDASLKRLEGGSVKYSSMRPVLDSLQMRGTVEIDKSSNKAWAAPQREKEIQLLLDLWDNIELAKITIPPSVEARIKRKRQTELQLNRKALEVWDRPWK